MKNLYVGNLDFHATEEEIRNLFRKHGAVNRVSIPRDAITGKSRGFAFVEMPDDTEAERAIRELNGLKLGGRRLTVNEARPGPGRAASRDKGERSAGRG